MKFFNKNNKESNIKSDNLLLDFPSGSRYAESFRTLRTNLTFSSIEKDLSSILVTSSVEAEGKTNTVVNLGYTIAQSGSKVLLIDADLRRPRMTDVFSLKHKKGFTDIISNTFAKRLSKGNLIEYSIGDLLELIKLQKRTGELHIESGNKNSVIIYFFNGKAIDIYWKNRPNSKKLANTLVKKNLLTKEEVHLALEHQKKSVQRLGAILFSMGLVSKKKLSKELGIHTIEAMKVISGMIDGEFHFINLSQVKIESPISQNVNFDKLFKEFLGYGEELQFINKSIVSAIHPTKVDNLYILPSGKIPPNPAEIIGSASTAFLMQLLKKNFDFIILDAPPVLPASDAMLMASRTDGTILVIKSGHVEKKILKSVVESFNNANLPILGILLNLVDLKKEGYYRYYNKYYSSYYEDPKKSS